MTANADHDSISKLLQIMEQLRDKENGCPWDVEQTFETIAPYTIEEAYEVVDRIEHNDFDGLKNELGDLLLQVVFHSQMAKELGLFSFDDVVAAISDKMIDRHPHVFATEERTSIEEQTLAWEDMKAQERKNNEGATSALDGVAIALPSLLRAQKIQNRAARVGFDWPDTAPIFEKVEEETSELKQAIENKDEDNITEEIGDLLFVCVNLARKLGRDAEGTLKMANKKFETRFRQMENRASARGQEFSALSLDEQEALWTDIKKMPSD